MTFIVEPQSKKAAYFEVGDVILWGKYKNKKGRIVSFEMDEKGQPVVEIEPVPKGQKKNKKMTLFKIRKAPAEGKTAASVAQRFQGRTTSSRVAARYKEAYAEREARLIMKAYESLRKETTQFKDWQRQYDQARKNSAQKKTLAQNTENSLKHSLEFAEILRDGIDLFLKAYKPTTEDKAREFEILKGQWNSWRRDVDAFIKSAKEKLAKGDPEGYFWPANLVELMLNSAGPVAHAAYQVTMPDLKDPEVNAKAPVIDALREYASGKVVGIARQVVKDLGRDKKAIAIFVRELLEDVNMHKLSTAAKLLLRATGDDEGAAASATDVGKKVSWRPDHAIGVAYAALKAVGLVDKAEQFLAQAAEDRWVEWKFKRVEDAASV